MDYATAWHGGSAFEEFVAGPGRWQDEDGNLESSGSSLEDSSVQQDVQVQLNLQNLVPEPFLHNQEWRHEWQERHGQAAKPQASTAVADDPPARAVRVAKELRALLDFYFEAFNFQHNKFMLDLVLGKLVRKAFFGTKDLAELEFSPKELRGLNRINTALEKLYYHRCEMLPMEGTGFRLRRKWGAPGQSVEIGLKNLRYTGRSFQLTTLPEVRGFASAGPNLDDLVDHFMTVPYARSKAPKEKFSLVALNCSEVREKGLPEETLQQVEGRIRRQIMLYHADIIVLQGLHPLHGPVGVGVAFALREEGYKYALLTAGEEVSTVFWDTERFQLAGNLEHAADLKFAEAAQSALRVACIQAKVPSQHPELLGEEALVVAADCLPIGGAEVKHMLQDFDQLRSAYVDINQEEPLAPVGLWDPLGRRQKAVRLGSSGTLRLHRPDCLLYRGLDVVATLSPHTAMYLKNLSPEDALSQFPAMRMTLMAIFQWRSSPRTP